MHYVLNQSQMFRAANQTTWTKPNRDPLSMDLFGGLGTLFLPKGAAVTNMCSPQCGCNVVKSRDGKNTTLNQMYTSTQLFTWNIINDARCETWSTQQKCKGSISLLWIKSISMIKHHKLKEDGRTMTILCALMSSGASMIINIVALMPHWKSLSNTSEGGSSFVITIYNSLDLNAQLVRRKKKDVDLSSLQDGFWNSKPKFAWRA